MADVQRIRAKDFRAWFNRNLKEQARDIAEHGADAGWPRITYTADTVKLFDRYGDEIWEMLADDADDQGLSVPALIAQFQRVDMAETLPTFKNLMVWYACEKIAREIADGGSDGE